MTQIGTLCSQSGEFVRFSRANINGAVLDDASIREHIFRPNLAEPFAWSRVGTRVSSAGRSVENNLLNVPDEVGMLSLPRIVC